MLTPRCLPANSPDVTFGIEAALTQASRSRLLCSVLSSIALVTFEHMVWLA